MHACELRCTPVRYTPVRCTLVRYTPVRCVPVRCMPVRCTGHLRGVIIPKIMPSMKSSFQGSSGNLGSLPGNSASTAAQLGIPASQDLNCSRLRHYGTLVQELCASYGSSAMAPASQTSRKSTKGSVINRARPTPPSPQNLYELVRALGTQYSLDPAIQRVDARLLLTTILKVMMSMIRTPSTIKPLLEKRSVPACEYHRQIYSR